MILYSHNYVTLKSVCDHNSLDYIEVMDEICHSDVSFGNNYDTLIHRRVLEDILLKELDWARLDDSVLISLGS
jgi:hypothetical protein